MAVRIIKKYSNRRLYDTESSGYITLDELAEIIRSGSNVKVVDAKSDEDLTQGTLAQIVVESGAAKLLPTSLLMQMIRMGDDALAEFMTLYVAWAFEVYSEVKRGVGKIPGIGSIASFENDGALGKLLGLNPIFRAARNARGSGQRAKGTPMVHVDEPDPEVQELRRELDEMKAMIRELAEK